MSDPRKGERAEETRGQTWPGRVGAPVAMAGAAGLTSPDASGVQQDWWLAQAAADRDEGAFEQLVRRHTPALYAGALRATGDPQLAQDVVQQAWLSAWLHLPGFRQQSAVRTWLTRITTTTALNALRRVRPTAPLDEVAEPPAPLDTEQQVQRREQARAVRAAVATLPARQRDAVVLRDLEGLSYQQVADELGCSVSAVKSSLHRGRQALAQALEPYRPTVDEMPAPRQADPGGRTLAGSDD